MYTTNNSSRIYRVKKEIISFDHFLNIYDFSPDDMDQRGYRNPGYVLDEKENRVEKYIYSYFVNMFFLETRPNKTPTFGA